MADTLVPRERSLPAIIRREPPAPRGRTEEVRAHLQQSRERLRLAIDRLRLSARQLTPAAQIHQQPLTWVVGAFTVGLVLGLVTAPRPS